MNDEGQRSSVDCLPKDSEEAAVNTIRAYIYRTFRKRSRNQTLPSCVLRYTSHPSVLHNFVKRYDWLRSGSV